ncbi:hypothetical protein [Mycolicibacterium komossense]|uniref:Thiaminase-2/PQQC domain-containing protein n=1 Tax=Mycolicibacterium komossense TaxID=1779 RepID=A0ABT3CDX7_9MYCO|nr:hypothetical protein [Mycolicibacterium komossense]MCV7227685.1 hypothetical protein [Mycolicibacterium komossense]
MTTTHSQRIVKPRSQLHRTVPFIAHSASSKTPIVLIDQYEVPGVNIPTSVWGKMARAIDLRELAATIDPDTLTVLASEQFAAASEFVYGHPIWAEIRAGASAPLHAYLLETRHYLAAASARMSPALARGIGLCPLTLLLSKHLLEEWDHAKYYAAALEQLGCQRDLIARARPLPTTLEWIHATRHIGYCDPLSAALCSGFMEFSSTELDTVLSWHDMLVNTGLLSQDANDAIRGHVDIDVHFGHAQNWQNAINVAGTLPAAAAARALNAVATIAESIYRWLSSLIDGAGASIVAGMQLLETAEVADNLLPNNALHDSDLEVRIYDCLPVWPAPLLKTATWGDSEFSTAADIVCGLNYAFGNELTSLRNSELATVIDEYAARIAPPPTTMMGTTNELDGFVTGWLRAIDGHDLWDAMTDAAAEPELIAGYVLENYHYLASAAGHVGAAIASTTCPKIRAQLIEHLDDELTHCDMLGRALARHAGIQEPASMRPLPTTVAFVGFLQNIAHQDWTAYVLVSTFLQRSLSETRQNNRGEDFYRTIDTANPNNGALLTALRDHDAIDQVLGHDAKPTLRLEETLKSAPISTCSRTHAAVAASLAWSFLDGIERHYSSGTGALRQRMSWRA